MKRLQVTIRSKQRVSLGTGGERAFLTTSHPVIPGSVLRGALAAAWVAGGGTRDEEFRQVFETCRFGPVVPTTTAVLGQSINECKYHRGSSTHTEFHDEAFEGRLSVDDIGCSGRKRSSGGYAQTQFVTTTTTAMEPRKHVAASSQLFSRESIEKGTEFIGHIVAPEGVPLGRLRGITTAFVGGRGSVMGKCTIQFSPAGALPSWLPTDGPVVVRTTSPTILVEATGVSSSGFRVALERAGITVTDVWAHRFDSNSASGWHMASGLPKPAEVSLAPGATALITHPGRERLEALLDAGLGVRRNEGFGWLEIVAAPPPEQPHAPRQAPESVDTESTESPWLTEIKRLILTSDQAQWLANRLRERGEGYDMTTDVEDWREPGVERLSAPQREGLRVIVRDVPQDQRSSLAYMITKGKRR